MTNFTSSSSPIPAASVNQTALIDDWNGKKLS
jgi:hypothetical protein